MTYKFNPEVEKILCPIILRLEDGTEMDFSSGAELAAATFDKHWNIKSYDIEGKSLVITAYEFYEKRK